MLTFSEVMKESPSSGDVHSPGPLKRARSFISLIKDEVDIPFSVAKIDNDKHLIFGWASVVEKNGLIIIDKQGDVILPEDLEQAAYSFMLKSRQQGHMHTDIGIGRCIESMVFTKEKKALMGIEFPDKRIAWWTGFKVDDEAHWSAHKRGELKEFSIGGSGRRARI